jgi:hypothetical protein
MGDDSRGEEQFEEEQDEVEECVESIEVKLAMWEEGEQEPTYWTGWEGTKDGTTQVEGLCGLRLELFQVGRGGCPGFVVNLGR